MQGYIFDYRLGYVRKDCALPGFDKIGEDGGERLAALGGYTTHGQAVAGKSWAHLLHLAGAGKYQILSGCTDGYSSAQILTMFVREIPLLAPITVVCLSGFYNVAYKLGLVQNKKDAAFLRLHPFATPGHLHFYRKITPRLGLGNDEVFYGEENPIPAWKLWLRHMGDINCLCEEFGINFVAFLQPCVFSGTYRRSKRENAFLRERYGLSDSELKKISSGFGREYAQIAENAKGLEYIKDLSRIFDNHNDIYEDACHVREVFLPELAAAIAEGMA